MNQLTEMLFCAKFQVHFSKTIKLVIGQVKVLIENESLSIKLFLTKTQKNKSFPKRKRFIYFLL